MKLNDPLFASDDYPRAVILELEPLGTNTLTIEGTETTPDDSQDGGTDANNGDGSEENGSDITTRLLNDETTESSDPVPHPSGYYERIQFIYREYDVSNSDFMTQIGGGRD